MIPETLLSIEVARTMWGKVDVSNRRLTSPSQVDNDPMKFHRVVGCTGLNRVRTALTDVDQQTTAPMLSCVAAISVPTRNVEGRDLWSGILMAGFRFLDQRHVYSAVFQDYCKLVYFRSL